MDKKPIMVYELDCLSCGENGLVSTVSKGKISCPSCNREVEIFMPGQPRPLKDGEVPI